MHSVTKPVLLFVLEHVQLLGSDGLMALQKPLVSIDEPPPLGGLCAGASEQIVGVAVVPAGHSVHVPEKVEVGAEKVLGA